MGGQGCLRSAVLLLPEPGFQASHTPSPPQCPVPLPSTSAFALLFSLDPLFSPVYLLQKEGRNQLPLPLLAFFSSVKWGCMSFTW